MPRSRLRRCTVPASRRCCPRSRRATSTSSTPTPWIGCRAARPTSPRYSNGCAFAASSWRRARKAYFSPEVARRLGDSSFTSQIIPTIDGLVDFFARPREFLGETLANLPEAQLAAIGLVFLNDGRLRSPLEQDECLRLVADLYGVTLAQIRCALRDLDGSFLTCIEEGTERIWTYKHPTMADAYRRLVGPDPELVAIYVRGAP